MKRTKISPVPNDKNTKNTLKIKSAKIRKDLSEPKEIRQATRTLSLCLWVYIKRVLLLTKHTNQHPATDRHPESRKLNSSNKR